MNIHFIRIKLNILLVPSNLRKYVCTWIFNLRNILFNFHSKTILQRLYCIFCIMLHSIEPIRMVLCPTICCTIFNCMVYSTVKYYVETYRTVWLHIYSSIVLYTVSNYMVSYRIVSVFFPSLPFWIYGLIQNSIHLPLWIESSEWFKNEFELQNFMYF